MKNDILKLNTTANKIVIKDIYETIFDKKIRLRDIRISDKESMTYLFGKQFLRWDTHYHYPYKKQHPIANFLYLRSIENVLTHNKSHE